MFCDAVCCREASRFKRSVGAVPHVGRYYYIMRNGAHPSNLVLALNINLSRSV